MRKTLFIIALTLCLGWGNSSAFGQCGITTLYSDTSNMVLCDGESHTFQFSADGNCSGNYEYQISTGGAVLQPWSTTASYTVNSTQTLDSVAYILEGRCSACPTTTVSDTFFVVVARAPTLSAIPDICGGELVNITATPSGDDALTWWDGNDPMNSSILSPNGTFSTDTLTDTTLLYVGVTPNANLGGSALTGKIFITEVGLEGSSSTNSSNDYVEITNLFNVPVNTTGWVVALSDNYSNINSVNNTYWYLPNSFVPCSIISQRDELGSPDYWGSNIYWDPNQPGWVLIIDNNGDIVDALFWGWTAADIATFSATINGFNITINQLTDWIGNGVNSNCGTTGSVMQCFSRTGVADNNDANDFVCQPTSLNTVNPGLNCGWSVNKTCYYPATINVVPMPDIDSISNANVCDDYVLPPITGENLTGGAAFYTLSGGQGTAYHPGDSVTSGATFYIYDSTQTVPACVDETYFTLTLTHNTMNLDAGIDQILCNGDSAVFNAIGAPNYSWDPSVPNGSSLKLPVGSYQYVVTSTQGAGICVDTDTLNIVVNPMPPVANFMALITETCVGTPVPFVNYTDTLTGQTLVATWFFGDGDTSMVYGMSNTYDTTYHAYQQNGVYDIELVIENQFGCTDTNGVLQYITIVNGPQAAFTANPTTTDLSNPTVVFTNGSSGATHYSWYFGDGSGNSSDVNPTHIFPNTEPGTYLVSLLAMNDKNCTDTATQVITLVFPEPIYEIPNIFTPNGDGVNDAFKFVKYQNVSTVDMVITDRWGNVVFEYNGDANFAWNGKKDNSGTKCVDGTYFYKMTITGYGNLKENKEFGYIQLNGGK